MKMDLIVNSAHVIHLTGRQAVKSLNFNLSWVIFFFLYFPLIVTYVCLLVTFVESDHHHMLYIYACT